MFGGRLGTQELILILGVALLVFGPQKLPEIGKAVGKGLREFRKATTELKNSIDSDAEQPAPAPKQEVPAETVAQTPNDVVNKE